MSVTEMSEHLTAMPGILPDRVESLMSRAQYYLSLEVQGILLTVVASVGFVTNIINIRTFIAMGAFTDGVTSTFLCLAVSDFMMSCAAFAASCSIILIALEARWIPQLHLSQSSSGQQTGFLSPVDPTFLGIVSLSVMQLFSMTTISITVYLAVTRCLCVVQPLRFRNSVTVKKTVTFVVIVFTLSLVSRLPNLVHVRIVMMFDRRFNSSRPTLRLLPGREIIKDATWLSVDISSCVGAQIILVICIGIMLKGLRTASEFRSKASTNEFRSKIATATETISKSEEEKNRKSKTKENRIAKQMVFVSTIFVACNTPKLISYLTTNIEPEFDLGGRYQYLYQYSVTLFTVFDTLNSSVNMFIYYSYNSKFRKTLRKRK